MLELELLIKGIKTKYPELKQQQEAVQNMLNDCMNHALVEPTVQLEFLDLSALFPSSDKCYRQRFTENGIHYSWWGIWANGGTICGLEKIEYEAISGTRLSNLWLNMKPESDKENQLVNLIRMNIHSDLF